MHNFALQILKNSMKDKSQVFVNYWKNWGIDRTYVYEDNNL